MTEKKTKRRLADLCIFLAVLGLTTAICLALARIDNDNNPFAMAMYILAVALIARFTDGYLWGVLASLVGTFCVNYIFTIPFWALNVTYPGYPLTVTVMLGVSLLISALTTQIKRQEQLRLEAERERIQADLLRAIAHDLRTPLSAILGSATVLMEEDLPSEEQKTLAGGGDIGIKAGEAGIHFAAADHVFGFGKIIHFARFLSFLRIYSFLKI